MTTSRSIVIYVVRLTSRSLSRAHKVLASRPPRSYVCASVSLSLSLC